MKNIGCIALCLFASTANAAMIDFTGGTVYRNNGASAVTNGTTNFDNASYYVEDGFKLEFIFSSTPDSFGTHVGNYYNTGNDVFHAHWDSSPYGEVSEIRVSKLDGTTFDLGGFRVSTNTANGGGISDGNEMVWVNSSKQNEIFTVESDDWGLGSGTDPLITIADTNTLFDDISWFSFSNDALSSAVGLGLDNFFLDEAGDPNGEDPTAVPEPATLAILALGLAGLGVTRKKKVISYKAP